MKREISSNEGEEDVSDNPFFIQSVQLQIYQTVIYENEELRKLFLKELKNVDNDSLLMFSNENKIKVKNELIEFFE